MPPHAPSQKVWRACQPFLAHALQHSHSRRPTRALVVQAAKRNRTEASGGGRGKGPLYVTVEPDGSDLWRLDPIIDMLKEGAVRPNFRIVHLPGLTHTWCTGGRNANNMVDEHCCILRLGACMHEGQSGVAMSSHPFASQQP